jgi:hypothetical protein
MLMFYNWIVYCKLFMVLYGFVRNMSCIECGNLVVNVDQQHDLQRRRQNQTSNYSRPPTFWCCCVTAIDLEKQ